MSRTRRRKPFRPLARETAEVRRDLGKSFRLACRRLLRRGAELPRPRGTEGWVSW